METQELNIENTISIEQLPKITQHLEIISQNIENEVKNALSLEINDTESKKVAKTYRANLNKIKSAMEERRMYVKQEILKPYNEFEKIYKTLITEKLSNADSVLKERIELIENTEKNKKTKELVDFANEWLSYYKIENVITPEMVVPSITLSASEKSLKEQTKTAIETIYREINLINSEEHSNEVMVEYLKTLDYIKAKQTIIDRYAQMEKLEQEKKSKEVAKVVEIVEPVEERQECRFTVWATKSERIKIVQFLKELGVEYD